MKFNEKLVACRNKSGLLQEEIAEKLNVTMQTVIDWEQGKIQPEMDKIYKMSLLFDVPINDLMDDDIEDEANTPANNSITDLMVKITWIVILIAAIWFEVSLYIKTSDGTTGILTQIGNVIENFDLLAFNCTYEQYTGTFAQRPVIKVLEKVCKTNKRKDRNIVVGYKGKEYVDVDKISNIMANLSGERYHISFEYDEEGFINKAIIDQIYNDKERAEINGHLGTYTGVYARTNV